MVLVVQNLPANAGHLRCKLDPFLGKEGPLEEGMATHSSILPGESHGQRSLGLQSIGSQS